MHSHLELFFCLVKHPNFILIKALQSEPGDKLLKLRATKQGRARKSLIRCCFEFTSAPPLYRDSGKQQESVRLNQAAASEREKRNLMSLTTNVAVLGDIHCFKYTTPIISILKKNTCQCLTASVVIFEGKYLLNGQHYQITCSAGFCTY